MTKKLLYAALVLGIALACVIHFSLSKSKSQREQIMRCLSVPSLPSGLEIVAFEEDSFMDLLIKAEFVVDDRQVHELLTGRHWVKINNINNVITMERAIEGYEWSDKTTDAEVTHAELVIFRHKDSKVLCKMVYFCGS